MIYAVTALFIISWSLQLLCIRVLYCSRTRWLALSQAGQRSRARRLTGCWHLQVFGAMTRQAPSITTFAERPTKSKSWSRTSLAPFACWNHLESIWPRYTTLNLPLTLWVFWWFLTKIVTAPWFWQGDFWDFLDLLRDCATARSNIPWHTGYPIDRQWHRCHLHVWWLADNATKGEAFSSFVQIPAPFW